MEKWIEIENFPGYDISNFGRVKSKARILKYKNGKRKTLNEKIKEITITGNGYGVVTLKHEGIKKQFYIHLLVLQYFGKFKPTNKHECNHIDGNKTNNNINNLEWVTRSENMKHACLLGLHCTKGRCSGVKNGRSILTPEQVIKIRKLYSSGLYTQIKLSELFNISRSNIKVIINNESWKNL